MVGPRSNVRSVKGQWDQFSSSCFYSIKKRGTFDHVNSSTYSHQEEEHRAQVTPLDRRDRQGCQVDPDNTFRRSGGNIEYWAYKNILWDAARNDEEFYETCPDPAIPPVFLLNRELKKLARTPKTGEKVSPAVDEDQAMVRLTFVYE